MTEQLDQSTIRDIKAMEKRLLALELRVQRALESRLLDDLDDVEVPYGREDLATGYVLTLGTGGPTSSAGFLARFLPPNPSDLAIVASVAEWSDSGSFSDSSTFEFQQGVTVPAKSTQLVIITAKASSTTYIGGADGDQFEVPWKLLAFDGTFDPSATDPAYGTGVGDSGCQALLWAQNPTDAERGNNIVARVSDIASAQSFTGSVEITIRTQFTLTEIP